MARRDERTRSHAYDAPRDASAVRIVALWDGGSAWSNVAPGASIVVGRSEDADLQVLHKSVSREHVRIHVGSDVTLEDLGSANGVRVNGRIVRGKQRVALATHDVIEIGAAVLVVHATDAHAAPAHEPAAMDRTEKLVALVSKSSLSVLLLGETGVGKEVTAEAIHRQSLRARAAFVKVNCAAFTESLLDSELFGHVRGAFTGAIGDKLGLIAAADGGTLLLDEIGELPAPTQAKLLRTIENHEVRRVGALESTVVDVRFIAATNRDLQEMTKSGAFRSDLFFRLNGISIVIPPLRSRRDEIAPLALRFLADAAKHAGLRAPRIAPSGLAALLRHAWPGNVRELKHVIERALVLGEGHDIEPAHLQLDEAPAAALSEELESIEREHIIAALERTKNNQTEAAKLLGISRRTLINRLDHYKLPRPRK